MSFFPPSPSDIRVASRLRPEQVSVALADTTALETDISNRILEQSNYVELRIEQVTAPLGWPLNNAQLQQVYPHYDDSQLAGITTKQAALATLVTKLLVLGDLYDSAGQLNDRYQLEADNYTRRGEKLLDQLVEQLAWQVGRISPTGSVDGDGVSILTLEVGD